MGVAKCADFGLIGRDQRGGHQKPGLANPLRLQRLGRIGLHGRRTADDPRWSHVQPFHQLLVQCQNVLLGGFGLICHVGLQRTGVDGTDVGQRAADTVYYQFTRHALRAYLHM